MRLLFTKRQETAFAANRCVIIRSWPLTDRNTAGHLSLEIVDGKESTYISFWHQRDIQQSTQDRIKTQYEGGGAILGGFI